MFSQTKISFAASVLAFVAVGVTPRLSFADEISTHTAQTKSNTLPSKEITVDALRKYPQISVETEEKGLKAKYSGVALRTILAELLPDTKLDSMPEWKALTKRELVVELKGDDGFPSLVTATEIAMNKSGDRFVIAIEKDGKALDVAPQLICKKDEARTRCVRNVVSVKIISVAQ